MANKFFIIFDGPMGSGKSTITKSLIRKLKRTAVLDFDEQKATITDFGLDKKKDYEMLVKARKALTLCYMKYGFNILMDGGFARSDRMIPFIKLAEQKNYKILIYQFTAPNKVLLKRVVKRAAAKKEKTSLEEIQKYLTFHTENKYTGNDIVVLDSDKLSPEQINNKVMKDIKKL